ncbi:Fe2+-dependent dioxygenase [Thermithiobacillus plumbiphilus]|uniref:Fe2+-dependent dioxygenase n=1 Tax=Thermithiobacillus plumbiphilus TaxID=1729899 RepID=A0ABU9D7N3_9PROT
MLLEVNQVLDAAELAMIRQKLAEAEFDDGRITAGYQSAQVKRNRQLAETHPLAREIAEYIAQTVQRHPLFITGALPRRIFPPLINRYEAGMDFGLHVDNALRGRSEPLRTDVSCTLFLSEPGEYAGGELVVEDTYGSHAVKLAAGDMVLYPASSLHRVTPVTRGVRLAAFFWVESLIRDDSRRNLLLNLDVAIQSLTRKQPDAPELVQLTACYHNLLRMWAET